MDNQPQQPVNRPEDNPQPQPQTYPQPNQNAAPTQPNMVIGSNPQPYNSPSNIAPQVSYPIDSPTLASAPTPKRKSKKLLLSLCLILILVLIGGATYALVGKKTSYQSQVDKFITAVQTKNKTTANSLQSPAFTAELKKDVGTTSFEGYCQASGQLCTAFFSQSFLNKASVTTKSYTASKGTKGKELVYKANYSNETSNSGNLKCNDNSSTGTLTIDVIPKGNTWLVDSANPSVSASNITCTPTKSTATTTSTKSATTTPTATAAAANPYDGWGSDCDSQSSTCLYYPSTWTAQAGLGNQGFSISSASSDVSVGEEPEPSNCSTSQPGETNQLYVVSVNSVTSSSLSLDVVGGYFNNQLNGSPRYNPYYILTSKANVSKYGVKTGSTVAFPDSWTCYDYGVISGEASSQPTGSDDYNSTTQAAISWFSTSDAATSLQILKSVYTN